MVYDSYSIIKTGHDQTGQSLPLTFRMGAGRPGGYIYFSVPFVVLFGPTSLGIRSLSLISGVGIVILVYFLGKKIFNEKIALTVSALAAISPWDIYLSRGGFESHFALFLALFGVVTFLYAKERNRLYLVWALSWGVAIHTYPTYKLTLPLLFVVLFWYRESVKLIHIPGVLGLHLRKNRMFLIGVVILALFGALALRETFFGKSEERFYSINVFSDKSTSESVIQEINYERTISSLLKPVTPVFQNRIVVYSQLLVESYLRNLSLEFLFLDGDGNPRHNPGEMGMLYLIELPLLLVSAFYLYAKNKKVLVLLMGWVLIVPFATMLLGEPHALRNSLMIPAITLLTAFGVTNVSGSTSRIFAIILGIQLILILQKVYFVAPSKFADFWSYPAKKAVELAQENKNKYDFIYLSEQIDNIEYAYPVYTRTNPDEVIDQYLKMPKRYGNVLIADTKNLKYPEDASVLIVENAKKIKNFEGVTDIVYSLNLEPALVLYEVKP